MSNNIVTTERFPEVFGNVRKEFIGQGEAGYIIAQCTNSFEIKRISDDIDVDNVGRYGMEIRIFSQKREVKWCRSTIEKDYLMRELPNDMCSDSDIDEYWDEEQFLDIDTKRSKSLPKGVVVSTGGGRYELPEEIGINDVKLVIRNYFAYEEDTRRAYVKDWRILGFKGDQQ